MLRVCIETVCDVNLVKIEGKIFMLCKIVTTTGSVLHCNAS